MAQQFFDDARIRKYLLGDITQEDQEQIEQRLLIDEEFGEKLSMARTEMVDAYVAADLSAKEREKFEKHFLSTPEHVQTVKIARALNRRLEERSRDYARRDIAASKIQTPYDFRHLKAIISLTAGAILLVTGFVVWKVVKHEGTNNQVREAQERRANFENELVRLNHSA